MLENADYVNRAPTLPPGTWVACSPSAHQREHQVRLSR